MVTIFGRLFGRSNVKHEHCHTPRKVTHNGERAFDFSYECVKHGRKITVNGVMDTDTSAHAKERAEAIYKGLRSYIESHKTSKLTEEKLAKVVKKELHHGSDLLKISLDLKKK